MTKRQSLRILIAEDTQEAVRTLVELLKLEGYSVRVAEDGEEAVNLAHLTQPDVVIVDIGLPRLNGFEVARQIRAADWGKKAKVIAVSGHGEDAHVEQAKQVGIDRYFVKPADPNELLRVIAE